MILETRQLSLQINKKILCHHLNIRFQPGEIWGILGPNGCGKTTLLHCLMGLHSEFSGEIFLQQQSITDYSPKKRAQAMGILFQDFSPPFAQTVLEFCAGSRFPHLPYFKKLSSHDQKIIDDAVHVMQLQSMRNQSIQHLSGGEKRRLCIASLLIQSPQIFLLDEPTNHLDIKHQLHTLKLLQSLTREQQKTVVMTLHDLNIAESFCDQMLLIYPHGETRAGNTKEMLTRENLSRLYDYPLQKITQEKIALWWFGA